MQHHQHAAERKDIYQTVTDSIIAALEAGVKTWEKPRSTGFTESLPLRHCGERYRGINVLILWGAAQSAGFVSAYWMTYRQSQELGGQVRKGEKGTGIVYYGTHNKGESEESAEGDEGPGVFRFLKSFTVFNADQIAGLPEKFYSKPEINREIGERIDAFDNFVQRTGANVQHGGSRAFYRPSTDHIQMPEFEYFRDAEAYCATLAHELTHWTKPKHRLERDFGAVVHGDPGYAKEELVAELGASFIGAEFGFRPDHIENHAAYIANWLDILRNDKKFIFVAAAKAQAAADYLLAYMTEDASAQAAA